MRGLEHCAEESGSLPRHPGNLWLDLCISRTSLLARVDWKERLEAEAGSSPSSQEGGARTDS